MISLLINKQTHKGMQAALIMVTTYNDDMMRKVLLLMFISILPFIYCCSSDDPVSKPDAVLISITHSLSNSPGKLRIKYCKSVLNADWEVVGSQSWCKVTPSSGSTGAASVTITVEENTSGSPKQQNWHSNRVRTQQLIQFLNLLKLLSCRLSVVWNDEFNASRLSGGRPFYLLLLIGLMKQVTTVGK